MDIAKIPPRRRAALFIHQLPLIEQFRVLSTLDDWQVAQLQPMLAELDKLSGATMAPAQLSAIRKMSVRDFARRMLDEQVAQMHPDDIIRGVREWSANIVARFLSEMAWPWRDAVLERLPDDRLAEVDAFLQLGGWPLAPAVRAALCERLINASTQSSTADAECGPKRNRRGASLLTRCTLGMKGWLRWSR